MTDDQAARLFLPHVVEKIDEISKGKRLVHYTSAEAAFRIISGGEVWMRNAILMNDFSEIHHGLECLTAAWASESGAKLRQAIEAVKPGLSKEIADLFDGHANQMRMNTYITSVSEHDDAEDEHGRLSMWRAYGGRSGVALVLNNDIFLADSDKLGVVSAPVLYKSVPEFVSWFSCWSSRIVDVGDGLASLGDEAVRSWLFTAFRCFALCTKHPGFKEEKEWRVFFTSGLDEYTWWLKSDFEMVNQTPQRIVKIKLHNGSNDVIHGLSINELINRVIIGPCSFPLQVGEAIINALEHAGVEDPSQRVFFSDVPLRQA